MVCKFCNNELEDGSDFCYICGQKVEEEVPAEAPVYAAGNTESVYSQPAPAPAPQAVYQAPEAPAPVQVQQPVAPDEGKKSKKVKDKSQAGKAAKFFSFLIPLIGLILYYKAKKNGYEEKSIAILNALMTGLNVYMALIVVSMIKKYML